MHKEVRPRCLYREIFTNSGRTKHPNIFGARSFIFSWISPTPSTSNFCGKVLSKPKRTEYLLSFGGKLFAVKS